MDSDGPRSVPHHDRFLALYRWSKAFGQITLSGNISTGIGKNQPRSKKKPRAGGQRGGTRLVGVGACLVLCDNDGRDYKVRARQL